MLLRQAIHLRVTIKIFYPLLSVPNAVLKITNCVTHEELIWLRNCSVKIRVGVQLILRTLQYYRNHNQGAF